MICPVCGEREANSWSTVDVYSDTTIECCEDCRDLLSQAKRYQWNGNMLKRWYETNRAKLTNAVNALLAEYERQYKA